jgi:penicillin amidase
MVVILRHTPYPLLGHNRDYAYGLIYVLKMMISICIRKKNNPTNAKINTKRLKVMQLINRKKTIKVKDSADVI